MLQKDLGEGDQQGHPEGCLSVGFWLAEDLLSKEPLLRSRCWRRKGQLKNEMIKVDHEEQLVGPGIHVMMELTCRKDTVGKGG